MKHLAVALTFTCIACVPTPAVDAGSSFDAGSNFDAGAAIDAGESIDAGPRDAGICARCPHGTWCLRDTCVPECAPCRTADDCIDGGTCGAGASCVFVDPGCTGPAVESVRIGVQGAWLYPDLYELDVATGRLRITLERPAPDGGSESRDGGVLFIDAGVWATAPVWCPYDAFREECAFDVAALDVDVSGGGQTNHFTYSTGAAHLPASHAALMDLFAQARQ